MKVCRHEQTERKNRRELTAEPGAVEALGGERAVEPFLQRDAIADESIASGSSYASAAAIARQQDRRDGDDHEDERDYGYEARGQQTARAASRALRHEFLQAQKKPEINQYV